MMKKVIYFIVLVMFIPRIRSQICKLRTESGVIQNVCCADYEKRENDCIACPNGYTSVSDENCKPCSGNTYGERCRFDCSCSRFEICDNVKGCVKYSSTTVTFVQLSGDKTCKLETESGKIKKVCCADFEEKGKGCTACSKGYTSQMGQNCRPCPNNTYGEKCRYDCSCSRFEICDLVKGCVSIPSTTDTSMYISTYDRTSKWTRKRGTDSENNSMTLAWDLDERTNGKSTDNSFGDLLSRKIITYYTLTLMVVVPGICFCLIFYKYKIMTKKKAATIINPRNASLHNPSYNIETEESLHDNTDDTEMLEFIEQNEVSPDHLGVINGSVSISSFDKGQYERKQGYINQPVIEAPPTNRDCITQATVHRMDSSLPDNDGSTLSEHEYVLQHLNAPTKDTLRLPYEYDISSSNVEFTVPNRCFSNIPERVSQSCHNLNTDSFKLRISSETNGKDSNSTDDNLLDFCNIFKSKSESNIL